MPVLIVSLGMANTKPFVSLACLCEKALQESDKVLSLVRIIDTFTVAPPPPGLPADVKQAIDITIVVGLKSGDLVGSYEASLRMRSPDGNVSEAPPHKWPIVFTGGQQGANAIVRITLPVDGYGLYWFDVLWDSEVLTSIPFKLVEGSTPSAGEKGRT